MELFRHQEQALNDLQDLNRVAFYHDMGLGKTFTGAEKMLRLKGDINLIICQKSKVEDWLKHFCDVLDLGCCTYDLTKAKEYELYLQEVNDRFDSTVFGVINYDLIFRRPELQKMHIDTLMLDESSMIQNESSKRTKAILKLKTDNVILLSGTPVGGKYERLWSQMKLLGWNITKKQYWSDYVESRDLKVGGFSIPVVTGYKNIGRLKRQMRRHGCHFLKTSEVFDLPEQTFTEVKVKTSPEYRKFKKSKIIEIDGEKLKGDTLFKKMLYERQLCGMYSREKQEAFSDILNSTEDRLIVFYNFEEEFRILKDICKKAGRKISTINGQSRDLSEYEKDDSSVTLIQYQAGAMGLNLQKANKIIYFTPPLSSELYEQSKKRTHRIGQKRACFYWNMICENSVEEDIYKTLAMREDYTEILFKKG